MISPKVSIALCTYNGAAHLEEQLASLVKQDYSNFEIIVLDDKSQDKTLAILKEFSQEYGESLIKVYSNEINLGYIKNFEKVIGLCSGDYIALCDQDDIWHLSKLSKLVSAIGENILIYHDSEFIDNDGNTLNRTMADVRNFYSGNDSRVFLFENCVSGHAMMFKKELIKYAIPFYDNIYHDWWLIYAASNVGNVSYLNECLVKYRQHENANTNILRQDRKDQKKRDAILAIEKEVQRIAFFQSFTHNNHQKFKTKLLKLAKARLTAYFSFRLAFFIFLNRGKLLFIQRKSALSKINLIIKYAWGMKLKKLFRKS